MKFFVCIFWLRDQIETMPFVASGVPVLNSGSSENVTKLSGGWGIRMVPHSWMDKAIGNKFRKN